MTSRRIKRLGTQAFKLTELIWPLLEGKDPDVIGAALAYSLAMLLASHFVKDNETATVMLREELLRMHVSQVRDMIPVAVEELEHRRKQRANS
jgi:hypothetical protein